MSFIFYSRRVQAWAALIALIALLGLVGCASTPAPPKGETAPAPALEMPAPKPKRLGLALGGGGARGFAHVGVLQVLEEAGIKTDLVVGTSAGSLVGALHASGKTGAQLQRIAETMEESTITDWALPFLNRGVLRGEALARYVSNQTQGRKIEDLPIRLGIVATDLNLGEGVLFQRGDTATAVRASSAVPSVFLPVRINNRDYVDGGLVAPVPVRYAREMGAEVVLAIDISTTPEGSQAESMLQILLQTFNIMGKSIKALELKEADVVVRPSLGGVSSADFNARLRAIEAGRVAMLAALPALKSALATPR